MKYELWLEDTRLKATCMDVVDNATVFTASVILNQTEWRRLVDNFNAGLITKWTMNINELSVTFEGNIRGMLQLGPSQNGFVSVDIEVMMLEVMDNNQRWPEGGEVKYDMLIERAKLLGDSKCVDGREGNVVSPWRYGQPLPDLKAEVSGLPKKFTDSFMLIPTSKKDVKFLRELAVRW
jgi:hypothetical protein